MGVTAAVEVTDAWLVIAFVAIAGVFAGYIARGKVSGRLSLELGRRGWLIAVVLCSVTVVSLLLGLGDEAFGEHTSAVSQVAALLTILGGTVGLWFAGGGQLVADAAFVVVEATGPSKTLEADEIVPAELVGDPFFNGKTKDGQVANESFSYWSDGTETPIAENAEVPPEALEQKPNLKFAVVWETTKPVDVPDGPPRPFVVGALVDAAVAALPKFKDKVQDGKKVTDEFTHAGETIRVGRILTGDETRWAEAEGKTEPVKVAIEPISYQPTKTEPVKTRVGSEQRQLTRYRDVLRELRVATPATSYRKGAVKRLVPKGQAIPDDAGAEARKRKRSATLVKQDFSYNGWIFKQGDTIPKDAQRFVTDKPTSWRRGGYLRALIVGQDNRWSTSKTQAILWTYVVAYILLSLLYYSAVLKEMLNGHAVVDDTTAPAFSNLELPDAYYVLLGGPFAAFVLAKTFTAAKVENGTLVKPDADSTAGPVEGVGQLVNDDAGQTDLVDFQYFTFNLIALSFVLVTFGLHLADGFPEVPAVLFGLTSASALAYTAKKGVERTVPQITNVSPRRVRPGDVLDIWGRNLVLTNDKPPEVQVNGRRAEGVKIVAGGTLSVDHLQLTLGDLNDAATVTVAVVPAGARPTDSVELDVDGLVLEDVVPLPIKVAPETRIAIKGSGFGDPGSALRATLGGVPLVMAAPAQPGIVVATLDPQARYPTGDQVLLELRAGERTVTRLVPVEALRIDRVRPSPIKLDANQDILVVGAGFAGEKPTVALDGIPLVVESNGETELLARLDPASLAASRYDARDDARLRVARQSYETHATVSVAA